jgi:hypothetical protein
MTLAFPFDPIADVHGVSVFAFAFAFAFAFSWIAPQTVHRNVGVREFPFGGQ